MMKSSDQNNSQPIAPSLMRWLGIIVAGLVLYLLSSGPAVYFRERGVISKQLVRTIYTPLIGVDDERFDGYLGWWVEKGRVKKS